MGYRIQCGKKRGRAFGKSFCSSRRRRFMQLALCVMASFRTRVSQKRRSRLAGNKKRRRQGTRRPFYTKRFFFALDTERIFYLQTHRTGKDPYKRKRSPRPRSFGTEPYERDSPSRPLSKILFSHCRLFGSFGFDRSRHCPRSLFFNRRRILCKGALGSARFRFGHTACARGRSGVRRRYFIEPRHHPAVIRRRLRVKTF